MYAEGQGMPQNYTEAVKWYRLAADQGDADAQTNLGTMYYFGKAVPQDYGEAMKWYRLAAEQGVAGAQYNLGGMYANSLGVRQNNVQAYMWISLAAAQGHELAAKGVEFLEKEMTPDQLAEAQRLAREWTAKEK